MTTVKVPLYPVQYFKKARFEDTVEIPRLIDIQKWSERSKEDSKLPKSVEDERLGIIERVRLATDDVEAAVRYTYRGGYAYFCLACEGCERKKGCAHLGCYSVLS